MAAVRERERRSTAGKRMAKLTGEALEDDEAFWGHETWNDADDSGNESFHSSDEASENRQDEFDSDFDVSESDHEEDEIAAGEEEERQLAREERSKKRKAQQRSYMDVSKAGRELLVKMQPTKARIGKGKRIIGDGLNAGIVLNIPGQQQLPVRSAPLPATVPARLVPAVQPAAPPKLPPAGQKTLRKKVTGPTLAATRSKRHARAARHKEEPTGVKPKTATKAAAAAAVKKKEKQTFTQEQLLLEAVNETEPENVRWLHGRKRKQAEIDEAAAPREARGTGTVVIEKFVSRRGYLNTITFPDMDHVPTIFQHQHQTKAPKRGPKTCVITGKPARYRDPKTGKGYYDAAAFKELRRRHAAKEPLDQRKSTKKPAPEASATSEAPNASKPSGTLPGKAANEAAATKSVPTRKNDMHSTATSTLVAATGSAAASNKSDPTAPQQNQTVNVPTANDVAKSAMVTSDSKSSASSSKAISNHLPAVNPTKMVVSVSTGPNGGAPSSETNGGGGASSGPVVQSKLERRGSTGSAASSSGTRSSPRRRKPSAKLLENSAT